MELRRGMKICLWRMENLQVGIVIRRVGNVKFKDTL